MRFKAKNTATRRTKNRFNEHTLIPISDMGGIVSEVFTREFSDTVHGFKGRMCQAFCSTERNGKDPHGWVPRWFGWIPVDEIEEIKGSKT
jgi:hypothetical protein